jgi:hypothetical protein
MNWLSKAIVLPLFISTLNIAPVKAEQIDRSRAQVGDYLPSVTDLNLVVPVPDPALSTDNLEPANSIAPFWSNPDRDNRSTTAIKKPAIRVKNTSRYNQKLLGSNINSSTPLSLSAQQPIVIKPQSKQKGLVATNPESSSAGSSSSTNKTKPISKQKLATGSRLPLSGNYLRLVRDPNKGTNAVGNPIYTLEAYVDGQRYQTFDVVSGTATTQTIDRHQGNNAAPLPDGLYDVSNHITPGLLPEVGKTFIGIYPKFETGRNDLGIHLDRSFNKTNGYDGTAGCIGMTTPDDRDAINKFVTKYHPNNLFVSIGSSPN